MKKHLIFFSIFCFLANLTAQDLKFKKIEISKLGGIKPVYFEIPKESVYKVVVTTDGIYSKLIIPFSLDRIDNMNGRAITSTGNETTDQTLISQKNSDYIFEISTNGLQNAHASEFGRKRYVSDYTLLVTFNMSCTLKIKNKAGDILKTVIIDDGSNKHIEHFYQNYMETDGQPYSISTELKGYNILDNTLKQKAYDYYNKNRNDILAHIEKKQMNIFAAQYNKVLEFACSKISTGKPELFVIDAKQKTIYPELDKKNEELNAVINEIYNDGIDKQKQERAKLLGDFFVEKIEKAEGKSMFKFLSQNAFCAYTVGRELDKAYEIYRAYKNTDNGYTPGFIFGRMGYTYDNMLFVDQMLDAKDDNICQLKPVKTLDMLDDEIWQKEQEEKDKIDAKRRSFDVENKSGYIIDSNNDKIEGRIVSLLLLADSEPGKIDLSYGKSFWFKETNSNDIKKKREKDAKRIVVNNVTYVFADGRLSVLMHENTNILVVYSPEKNEYKLLKVDSEKAIQMSRFEKNDKKGLEFVADCKVALDLISTSHLKNDLQDAIKLCDTLASCK